MALQKHPTSVPRWHRRAAEKRLYRLRTASQRLEASAFGSGPWRAKSGEEKEIIGIVRRKIIHRDQPRPVLALLNQTEAAMESTYHRPASPARDRSHMAAEFAGHRLKLKDSRHRKTVATKTGDFPPPRRARFCRERCGL